MSKAADAQKKKILKTFSYIYNNKYEQRWVQKFKLMALLFRYPI